MEEGFGPKDQGEMVRGTTIKSARNLGLKRAFLTKCSSGKILGDVRDTWGSSEAWLPRSDPEGRWPLWMVRQQGIPGLSAVGELLRPVKACLAHTVRWATWGGEGAVEEAGGMGLSLHSIHFACR